MGYEIFNINTAREQTANHSDKIKKLLDMINEQIDINSNQGYINAGFCLGKKEMYYADRIKDLYESAGYKVESYTTMLYPKTYITITWE